MSHVSASGARHELVRLANKYDALSLQSAQSFESLATLLHLPLSTITAHFRTDCGLIFAAFERRDLEWNEALRAVLREHGTIDGLEHMLRRPAERMPLLEFIMNDPYVSDASGAWDRVLHRSQAKFRQDISESCRRDLLAKPNHEDPRIDALVSALIKLFMTLEDQGDDSLDPEKTALIWRREAMTLFEKWPTAGIAIMDLDES